MKRLLLLVPLAAAACGGPPAGVDHRAMETADAPFAAAPRDRIDDILSKPALSLEDALAVADVRNPELNAARKNIDLAAAAEWEASLYPNPSLQLGVEDFAPNSGSLGRSKRTAGLTQPVIVGGRRGAAMDVARKERDIEAVRYLWTRRTILTNVKRAYSDVLVATQAVDLARRTRDLSKTFHDLVRKQFEAQAVAEAPLLKAAVDLAKAEIELAAAESRLTAGLKSFKGMLGNVDLAVETLSGKLRTSFDPPPLDDLRRRIEGGDPRVRLALLGKERAELLRDLAEAEAVPDVGVQAAGGADESGNGVVEFGFDVPLPIFNHNQAKVAAAEIMIRQAEFEIAAQKNAVVVDLTEKYMAFTAARTRVSGYKDTILPKARTALEQTTQGYEAGNFTFLEVLDAQRTLAESTAAFVDALQDLNTLAAELEKLSGEALPGTE